MSIQRVSSILLCLFFFYFLSAHNSYAQIKKTGTETVRPVLEKVVSASAQDFVSIRGDQIPGDPGTTQYLSLAELPSALQTKIIGYSGSTIDYWVWECKLLATEDFNELKKIYRHYFNDISGGMLKTTSRKFISSEKYEGPVEEMRQCINTFNVAGTEASNASLTIDLVAENILFEWVIWLRVYDKKKMFADQ